MRAYRLARRQQPVELRAVEVTVHSFEILALRDAELQCRVRCAPGFYMRSLAHDLGRALGCGACLQSLRREGSGAFTLDQAVTLEALGGEGAAPARHRLVALAELLPELPAVVVTGRGAERAAHGNLLRAGDVGPRRDSRPSHRRRRGSRCTTRPGRCWRLRRRRPAALCIPGSSWCKMRSC